MTHSSRHHPTVELGNAAGRAIVDLFDRIKRIEGAGPDWPGADVVDVLTGWFTELGIDTGAPAGSLAAGAAPGTAHQFTPSAGAETRCRDCQRLALYRHGDGRWYWLEDNQLWSAPAEPDVTSAGYGQPHLSAAAPVRLNPAAEYGYELGYLTRVLAEDRL